MLLPFQGRHLLWLCLMPMFSLGQPPAPVRTESGLVSGIYNPATGVTSFKGIPYAAPPVGALRWKAPQPVAPWKGVLVCDRFSASPMQAEPKPFFVIGPEFTAPATPLSEDCLYLNVWTTAKKSNRKLPVFVWIYGGGFFSGGAAAPGYDGEALAKKGVLFVSFNYRLGVFGFLAHPELSAESPHKSSGNYGLLDQLALLQWVKKNIAAFGGDPENVTIAGQSAGSVSVNCLMVSPLADHLFQRAIAESGTLILPNPIMGTPYLSQAEKNGLRLARNATGDSTIESLRKMPAAELQKKSGGLYSPVIDGYVITSSVSETYAKGSQRPVSFLTGWNADEGFVFAIPKAKDFQKNARDFGKDSARFLQLYPGNTDDEAALSTVALNRDEMIGAAGYLWASKQNPSGSSVGTYVYNFNRKPPSGSSKNYGAYHTAEIGYALNNLSKIQRPWEATDDSLASLMSSYWVNFASTGDPNGPGLPTWPAFRQQDVQVMILDEHSGAKPIPNKEQLEFLLSRYPGQRKP